MYHWIKKMRAIGFYRSVETIKHRTKRGIFNLNNNASEPTNWSLFEHFAIDEFFFHEIKPFTFLKYMHDLNTEKIRSLADPYMHNCFTIFDNEVRLQTIDWHSDFLLDSRSTTDHSFDSQCLSNDMELPIHVGKERGKDIKVPWELARFQYVPILAAAYFKTGDEAYADKAKELLISWLDANQFGYGIHWFNGMEVSIRAVNWIIAIQWLHEPLSNDIMFYKRLICSLYDHMRYLENNWEWYDGRTNNHYLANLVGYAYLCYFFQQLPGIQKKWDWCYQRIQDELAWQIFDEGASYEGSTHYHGLVTELFVHGFLIARYMNEIIDSQIQKKLLNMLIFIKCCQGTSDKNVMMIGDNDSGSLLDVRLFSIDYLAVYFNSDMQRVTYLSYGKKYYKEFGLLISKQRDWHVSLRHPTYAPRQPTGHFHHDSGSITLAYNGIPIVIDPGSYTYTGSVYWRNYFRSPSVHSTVYEPSEYEEPDLFALSRKSYIHDDISMRAYILFSDGVIGRLVVITDQQVRIIDECLFNEPTQLTWNFTLDPEITVKKSSDGTILLHHKDVVLHVRSTLSFSVDDAFTSHGYGIIKKTNCFRSSKEIVQAVITTSFYFV